MALDGGGAALDGGGGGAALDGGGGGGAALDGGGGGDDIRSLPYPGTRTGDQDCS